MNKQNVVIIDPDGEIKLGKDNISYEEEKKSKESKDMNIETDLENQERIVSCNNSVTNVNSILKEKICIVKLICIIDFCLQLMYLYRESLNINSSYFHFKILQLFIISIGYYSLTNLNTTAFLVYLIYQYYKTLLIFGYTITSYVILIDYYNSQSLLDYSSYQYEISIINNPKFITYCLFEILVQLYIIYYLEIFYSLLKKRNTIQTSSLF